MNTKGTKFLAVLAVLAMAFAAFAVIAPVEVSDAAETPTAGTAVDEAATVAVDADGNYVIGGEARTVTFTAEAAHTITNLQIPAGFTVVIGSNLTVTNVFAIYSNDGMKYESGDSITGIVVGADATVTVKVLTAAAGGSTATIEGTSTAAVAATGNLVVTVPEGKTLVYTKTPYAAPTIGTTQSFKWAATGTLMTIYGTQLPSVSLLTGDYFKPVKAGITIVDSEAGFGASVEILELNGKPYTGNLVFNVDGEKKLVTTDAGDITQGELRVVDGSLKLGSDHAYGPDVAVTGTIATAEDVSAGIATDVVINALLSPANNKIVGNFIVTDNNLKVAHDVIVEKNAMLTIPAKKTMTIGQSSYGAALNTITLSVVADGAIDVWGKLTAVTGKDNSNPKQDVIPGITNAGTIVIRSGAQVTGFVNAAGGNNITGAGAVKEMPAIDLADLTYINGVIESDASYANVAINGAADLTIKEGVTMTITSMMALNGRTLTVNGTLVIAEGASLGDNGTTANGAGIIVLGGNGKIVNNGTIGKYVPVEVTDGVKSVDTVGVSGVAISIETINKVKTLVVSGTIVSADNANYSMIDTDAVIYDASIAAKVFSDLDGATLAEGKTLTMGGIAQAGTLTISLDSVFDLTGYALDNFIVTADTTPITGVAKDVAPGATTTVKFVSVKDNGDNPIAYPTGITLTVIKTPFKSGATEKYYQRLYIEGNLTSNVSVKSSDLGLAGKPGEIQITAGILFVAEGKELNQNGFVKLKVEAGKIVAEGKITSLEVSNTTPTAFGNLAGVVGATYAITTTGENPTTTYYAENVNSALAGITANREITLTGLANYTVDLAADLTVAKDMSVAQAVAAILKVPADRTITVQNDGTFDALAIAELKGKLVVFADGACSPAVALYDVSSTDEADTVTYCGLQVALNEAVAGATIEISKNIETPVESLVVPQGVKLIIGATGHLTVKKTLTVSTEASIEVSGTLNFGNATTKNAKMTVIGTLDISAGSATATFVNNGEDVAKYGMTIESTGALIYKDSQNFAGAKIVGVVYKDGTKNVLTSMENAIAAEPENIDISGTYTTEAAIDLGETTLTIKDGATASLATVTIKGGSIVTEGTGAVTAKVAGTTGTSDSAQVSVTKFKGTISDAVADDKYTMSIDAMDAGSVTILAGTVVLADTTTTLAAEQTFAVAAGATLKISNAIVIQGAADSKIDLAGDVVIDKNKSLVLDNNGTNMKIAISGNVTINQGAELEIDAATISGTVTVDGTLAIVEATTVTGSIVVNPSEETPGVLDLDANVTLGTKTLGAAPMISGPVDLDDAHYIMVFPGASLDDAAKKTLMSTELCLNGLLYGTAYAKKDDTTVKIAGADPAVMVTGTVITITGYDMAGIDEAGNWKTADKQAITNLIGGNDQVYFSGEAGTARVLVSYGVGITVAVDGVIYDSSTTINNVAMGAHTVVVTINPGYKGTTSATFNGNAITNSFEITPELADGSTYKLLVTGDIVIDTGDVPEPEVGGLGLTEILLIVLVILIAIMVVVILIRMNRS